MDRKQTCAKCDKIYTAQRLGGRYCSQSCANAYRQQLKRNELVKAKLVERGEAAQETVSTGEAEMGAWIKAMVERGKRLEADRAGTESQQQGFKERVSSFVNDIVLQGDKFAGDCDKRYLAQEEAAKRLKDRRLKYTATSHEKKVKSAEDAKNIDNLLVADKIDMDKDNNVDI